MSHIPFDVGHKVEYTTNRGTHGSGVIIEIRATGKRGPWYIVEDNLSDKKVAVREVGLYHAKK